MGSIEHGPASNDEGQFVDYYEIVRESIHETGALPIFVSGLPYFGTAVALFPDENGNVGRLIHLFPYPNHWNNLYMTFGDELSRNGWLEYSEVKEYVRKHPPAGPSNLSGVGNSGSSPDAASGGTSLSWLVYILIFIVMFGLAVVFTIMHKKKISTK